MLRFSSLPEENGDRHPRGILSDEKLNGSLLLSRLPTASFANLRINVSFYLINTRQCRLYTYPET